MRAAFMWKGNGFIFFVSARRLPACRTRIIRNYQANDQHTWIVLEFLQCGHHSIAVWKDGSAPWTCGSFVISQRLAF
jgi:hypothetical protein